MKHLSIFLFSAFLFFSACNSGGSENENNNNTDTTSVTPPFDNQQQQNQVYQDQTQQTPPAGENIPEVMQQTGTIGDTTGKRLNPPHGEPGHRCDIPVGQPLP